MKRLLLLLFCLLTAPAHAHFQTLLPNTDIVTAGTSKTVQLLLQFTHPMQQGPVMPMAKPVQFAVWSRGQTHDLLPQLQAQTASNGATFYQAEYRFTRPADYLFYLEPAPYWEASEGKLIIHYTKVVVNAFEAEHGWDHLLGLPVEIEPLVRPYGLWTGNQFRGIVRHQGQVVPFATVEVEYFNQDHIKIPAAPFTTQVIKADSQGVFSYSFPRAGWWGFAALLEADAPQPNPAGELVPVELGGLLWIHTSDMQP